MPNFINSNDIPHDASPTTGILLTNLGTPEAPTSSALRRYLAEFLNDPRVIETPRLIWWPILYGIILTFRPRRSAHAYGKVWTDEGSPLLVNLQRQAQAIESVLTDSVSYPLKVEIAMRYGEPSIKNALRKLRESNIQRLLVFPLYPQYSATTTASTFDAITDELQKWRWVPEVRFISHYHDDPGYITALAASIRSQWDEKGKPEKLLFSFHGLPKKYFLSGDPYFCECHKTARLVAEELGLEDSIWQVAFQSRFGPMEWLQPYTDVVLESWANEGISNVHVICPGFSADCLETLEEIQIQYPPRSQDNLQKTLDRSH
ncbi:MAG: ferrochelatase, partial [Gammaproteobacteria bacterium]|nr:ferrochelatase [Gammaproteobacteria bacterium]